MRKITENEAKKMQVSVGVLPLVKLAVLRASKAKL